MTLYEQSTKGQRAASLYDEFMAEYFQEAEERLFEAFRNAPNEQLQEIRMQLRTLDGMKLHLKEYIQTGEIATHQLGDKEYG